MLHHLEIENFYSIRDRQIIDLRAAANVQDDDCRLAPLWTGSKDRAPKVVALFGANASGKSNVLRALSFIAWFVQNSFAAGPDASFPFERFLDEKTSESTTALRIFFSGLENFEDKDRIDAVACCYSYEVVLGGGNSNKVQSENLYYWPSYASRRIKLFERDDRGKFSGSKYFSFKGYEQTLRNILRPNASVISTLKHVGHAFATLLCYYSSKIWSNILIKKGEYSDEFVIEHYLKDSILIESFNNQIERIGAGINKVNVMQSLKGPVAFFTHEGLQKDVPFFFESHGTQQFMKLYPLIFYALQSGGVAIIDELDSALHPKILAEVLRWFHSPERNPHNAQLWMSCHNASLLEDLTKEEVFFCEKDKTGQTHIYGLSDIRSRRDDNHYKKYVGGAYGAVPQIG